jgi:hypothetical protein
MCCKKQRTVTFMPRFTTLVGASSFSTTPLDVSTLESAKLQVWRGSMIGADIPRFAVYPEESHDGESWTQATGTPAGFDPGDGGTQFINYCFQLRWFRLRFELTGTDPMVTCWAEGSLQ